jgi:hypothetical protein
MPVHNGSNSAIIKRRKNNMHGPRRLTDSEVAEIRRRRRGVRASLACEGMYLTAEEEALFDRMDKERLPADESIERIIEFSRAKRHPKTST